MEYLVLAEHTLCNSQKRYFQDGKDLFTALRDDREGWPHCTRCGAPGVGHPVWSTRSWMTVLFPFCPSAWPAASYTPRRKLVETCLKFRVGTKRGIFKYVLSIKYCISFYIQCISLKRSLRWHLNDREEAFMI
ncbi:hypothetical protein OKW21_004971 [Catalinimonas alkaloidigena]|nr:hypothetical protein [Catalinimonas alkaloidigena]